VGCDCTAPDSRPSAAPTAWPVLEPDQVLPAAMLVFGALGIRIDPGEP
jgi:hypothetical protein